MNSRDHAKIYHGKIMLFGEYSVMEGSWAALIPYRKLQAKLSFPGENIKQEEVASNRLLRAFATYLGERNQKGPEYIDHLVLDHDLQQGLYLESTIPQNYGLGSSGALCAAVFEAYRTDPLRESQLSMQELRKLFADMESYFHGSSSGVDPLCIYLDEPLVIRNHEYQKPGVAGKDGRDNLKMFLIDTGHKSHTGPYVRHFRDQMKHSAYRNDFTLRYVPLVNEAVEQWLAGQLQMDTVMALSADQLLFFKGMVPASCHEIWRKGIEKGLYACKLCGSGGGGMILGFTKDLERTADFLNSNYKILITPVT